MAQKTLVQLIDDIDSTAAAETVAFGLDGIVYEIDLNDANTIRLRAALAPYVEAGRRVGGASPRANAVPRSFSGYDPKAVRAWAASNGIEVPARGRIPNSILEQFRAAGH